MKKLLSLIVLLLGVIISVSAQNVENGWYKADVKYSNPSTYTTSNYTLNVEVKYNRVVKIDFEDGSLHAGSNNSGYTYTGGYLNYYSTTVYISKGYQTYTFTITLK